MHLHVHFISHFSPYEKEIIGQIYMYGNVLRFFFSKLHFGDVGEYKDFQHHLDFWLT